MRCLGLAAAFVILSAPTSLRASTPADSTLEAAKLALNRGLAWRASLLLAPILADSTRRTPEAVLLAARAASLWNGWSQVHALLASEQWTDSAFGGAGRALLARASLERGSDTAALRHAESAVRLAPDQRARGERLVVLARALDRLDSLDGAARTYAAAARLLPSIGDWLLYRSAIVTRDSVARSGRFGALTLLAARERVRSGEAEALQRSGDLARAAAAYAALGAHSDAYRLRAEAATGVDDSVRAALRAELLEVMRTREGTAEARAAAATLAGAFASLSPAEELAVARALTVTGGSRSRALEGYRKAFAARLGTSRDRHDYARQLFAVDRYAEAARQFARVTDPAPLAAAATYERGRALVRNGDLVAGRRVLRSVAARFPRESEPAASALFLLGDLAVDEQRDASAREAFRSLVARYPKSRLAPGAAFRAAIIAYVGGEPRTAALELDTLALRHGTHAEATAARYWAGRAWEAAGDSSAARARWRLGAERDREGYYGASSRKRLGGVPWSPPSAPDLFAAVPDVDSAIARAELLSDLGMNREARWEVEMVVRSADSTVERMLAVANALRAHGEASRAIRLALRALGRGAPPDARTYRLIYPVVHREAIAVEATSRGIYPELAAALIRQESMFTPGATSVAGARGLMQVMPDVGRTVARSLRFPVWDPVLLYQADVNVQLGMAHLDELVERYDETVKVLAGYNAGISRVERWSDREGVSDPEIFAERIPYSETRDYVRIIQRNQDYYRALYAWGDTP